MLNEKLREYGSSGVRSAFDSGRLLASQLLGDAVGKAVLCLKLLPVTGPLAGIGVYETSDRCAGKPLTGQDGAQSSIRL